MTMTMTMTMASGDEAWPPGFRFHPTDEELILYYLKRKICRRRLKLDILAQLDVYKYEPEELPGLSLLKNGDRQWFFFSPRDRKYPNGSRSNRATRHGYWKATGKDRTITCKSRNVGLKKTLVFYRGRAPSGARTDWVMHEYTLDEDELKRCQNVQDYYAVYKVFKKSGPGPKNGEQYGAPFREEDWVDDDHQEIASNTNKSNHDVEVNNVLANDSHKDAEVDALFDDIEEIMNRIVSEPPQKSDFDVSNQVLSQEITNDVVFEPAFQQPDIDDFEQALSQFIAEEENNSAMVNTSFGGATYAEPCTTYAMSAQPNGLEASYDVTHTATSGLLTWDAPEVTSNANTYDLPPVTVAEDFLEMDDLLAPGPVNDFNIYSETNYDGVLPGSCPKSQEGGWVNPVGYPLQPHQGLVPLPTTGVVSSCELNQNQQSGKEVERAAQAHQTTQTQTQTWFTSSTLWSFVESIPAAPASAAESALVNKAFQRMSSFSRVRLSTTLTAAQNKPTTSICSAGLEQIRGGKIRGFFLFSLLAALLAVLCVFIGSKSSSSSILGRSHCHLDL